MARPWTWVAELGEFPFAFSAVTGRSTRLLGYGESP